MERIFCFAKIKETREADLEAAGTTSTTVEVKKKKAARRGKKNGREYLPLRLPISAYRKRQDESAALESYGRGEWN